MKETGQEPELPDLIGADHLCGAMFSLGPTRGDAMGSRATDWPEIVPFAQATGRIDTGWEAETLFKMCAAYHAELHGGSDPFRISPIERAG